ncbi:hypothetical protein NDU88_008188 [Pleurodeles waltl]|uniref:Uncharacterized protein n=1 Tax=Pleurodeles waltl TaxID=8319 RepID=A0AAV7PVI1_PLEWA|nr:hypothetical protein NDU88_008188 [Pleurodeles waltl]
MCPVHDPGECKVTVCRVSVLPAGSGVDTPHCSPWRQDDIPSAGGDDCTVVELLVEGGSCPSPAISDSYTVVVLLLGGGSCPSLAMLNSCTVVELLVGEGTCPSPAPSDECTTMIGGGGSVTVLGPGSLPFLPAGADSLPFLPAGASSLLFLPAGPGSLLFMPAGADSLAFRVTVAGSLPFLPVGAVSLPFGLAGAGSFTVSTCGLDPFTPQVGAIPTAVDEKEMETYPVYRALVDLATLEERHIILTHRFDRGHNH